MESVVLRKIFTFFGIFPIKFDANTCSYKISSGLIIYSIFFIFFTNLYNIYMITSNLFVTFTNLYKGLQDETTGVVILVSDCFFWIFIGISLPIMILINIRQCCLLFNQLLELKDGSMRKFQIRLEIKIFSYLLFISILIPYVCVINSHLPFFFRLLSSYAYSAHLILGEVFEYLIFQWIFVFFKKYQITLDSHSDFHSQVIRFSNILKLIKRSNRIFGATKVVNIVFANALMSFFLFYNYDRIVNIDSTLLWQLMIMPIYYLCVLWDKVTFQVSAYLFKTLS